MQHSGRAVELLLVEDNPADARLTQEALAQGTVVSHVTVAPDGVEAMQFLRREPPQFASAPRPDLILLDLNLPRKNGREVLEEIKGDPGLRCIPVMVLSSSEAADDLQRVYNLHANCYIRKPACLGEFVELVRSIEQFWFGIVTLPTR
ncbi:MAG: response regulator [Bryobacteraceae bacterium]|jgi:CheY-like chemotaxis protein